MAKRRVTMPGAGKIKTYEEAQRVKNFWAGGAPEGTELQIRRTAEGYKVVQRIES